RGAPGRAAHERRHRSCPRSLYPRPYPFQGPTGGTLPSPGPDPTRNRVKTGKIDTKGLAHHTALDNRAARTGELDRPEALVRRITEADSQTRHARLAGAGGGGRDLDCADRPRRPQSRW